MKVEHVKKISGHPVLPVLARCMVEMAEYDLHYLSLNWSQSAFFVRHEGEVIAAMSYSLLPDENTYYIGCTFVDPGHRQRGVYRAMFDALTEKAKKEKVGEIQSSIAWNNSTMQNVAKSVGRTPIAVTYRMRVNP